MWTCTCVSVQWLPTWLCGTYHLQCTTEHANQYVREPQLVLRAAIVRQLDEVGKGVLVKHQRELFVVARPVGNCGRNVQEDLEADLYACELLLPQLLGYAGFATFEIISATSRKLVQVGALVLARKSSINRIPIL